MAQVARRPLQHLRFLGRTQFGEQFFGGFQDT
jgi:hypothetical protein